MSALSSKDSPPLSDQDKKVSPSRSSKDQSEESDTKSRSSDTDRGVSSPPEEGEAPPLPDEDAPPLPTETPPTKPEDDGWEPIWDDRTQAFYFFNRFTKLSQWDNPRVPEVQEPGPPGVGNYDRIAGAPASLPPKPVAGGYDPAVHGDYDPNADYAKVHEPGTQDDGGPGAPGTDPSQAYGATGAFNRFTGKWQNAEFTPERFNDENKSKRQMNAFFDVDAAANSHNGKSLKAERSGKKLSKQELKTFKEKRRERKEEKRRAWLRD